MGQTSAGNQGGQHGGSGAAGVGGVYGALLCARPVSGVHADQVQAAFEKTFRRYEATLKELSKV